MAIMRNNRFERCMWSPNEGNHVMQDEGNHKGLPLHTVDVASVLSPEGFAFPSREV